MKTGPGARCKVQGARCKVKNLRMTCFLAACSYWVFSTATLVSVRAQETRKNIVRAKLYEALISPRTLDAIEAAFFDNAERNVPRSLHTPLT